MLATIFTACWLVVSVYIYVASTVSDPVSEVLFTGGVYPIVALGLKEVLLKVVSVESDESDGLTEKDDVETGTFISFVTNTEVVLDFANKYAMARITSPHAFAATVVLSLVIEVIVKVTVTCWLRNKGVVEDRIKSAAAVVPSPQQLSRSFASSSTDDAETDEGTSEVKVEVETVKMDDTQALKKAAHRVG